MTDWERHFRSVTRRARGESDFGAEFGVDSATLAKVQAAVNRLGYAPPLTVDGVDGPKTQAAVQWVQAQRGLTVDGVVGPQTLGALGITASTPSPKSGGSTGQATHASVLQTFPAWTQKYEGRIPWMYPDSKGYVTTGVGNLVDPVGAALALPWVHKSDQSPASQDEVSTEWQLVKSRPEVYVTQGAGGYAGMTNLRLTNEVIDTLVRQKMAQNERVLASRYPNFAKFPADAQLFFHSNSWAWGPAFSSVWDRLGKGPLGTQFDALVNQKKPDFAGAMAIAKQASAHEEQINPGIRPRDESDWQLLQNAANVVRGNGNSSKLWWPGVAPAVAVVGGIFAWVVAGGVTILSYFAYEHKKKTGRWLP